MAEYGPRVQEKVLFFAPKVSANKRQKDTGTRQGKLEIEASNQGQTLCKDVGSTRHIFDDHRSSIVPVPCVTVCQVSYTRISTIRAKCCEQDRLMYPMVPTYMVPLWKAVATHFLNLAISPTFPLPRGIMTGRWRMTGSNHASRSATGMPSSVYQLR